VQHNRRTDGSEDIVSWDDLMAGASDDFAIEQTGLEDYAIMHYTSGTTGVARAGAAARSVGR
jgi:acyl-coenzyme A synthetase/AMP-(fatty) acid ligase